MKYVALAGGRGLGCGVLAAPACAAAGSDRKEGKRMFMSNAHGGEQPFYRRDDFPGSFTGEAGRGAVSPVSHALFGCPAGVDAGAAFGAGRASLAAAAGRRA